MCIYHNVCTCIYLHVCIYNIGIYEYIYIIHVNVYREICIDICIHEIIYVTIKTSRYKINKLRGFNFTYPVA